MPLTPRHDDPDIKEFWKFVERVAQEALRDRPDWAPKPTADPPAPRRRTSAHRAGQRSKNTPSTSTVAR